MSFHRAVFFDLDGTVIDSRPGIFRCVRAMLAETGRADIPDSELMQIIGPPLAAGFSRILGTGDSAVLDHAVRIYRAHYGAGGMFEAAVYDGIEDVLKELCARNRTVFLVTSKAQPFAGQILAHFGLDRYFSGISAPDLNSPHADKSQLVAAALEANECDARDAVMIGDRKYDMEGACANGVYAAGVLWGFGSEEELVSSGAQSLLSVPSEIPMSV